MKNTIKLAVIDWWKRLQVSTIWHFYGFDNVINLSGTQFLDNHAVH
jgi:hypothetical protein